jgi:hypothetical protein
MSGSGSTPRRPGGPARETELEQAERQLADAEERWRAKYAEFQQLQAQGLDYREAREQWFRLGVVVEDLRRGVEALKLAGR